jgi:hypothetical protein
MYAPVDLLPHSGLMSIEAPHYQSTRKTQPPAVRCCVDIQ